MTTQLRIKGLMALTCLFLISVMPAKAQMPSAQQETPSYSEEDLETFVEITEDIIELQQSYESKMAAAVQETGLTMEEFQEMAQAQQMGQELEATDEKKTAFSMAVQQVMAMQQEMNQEMKETVEEHEMDVQTYQAMSMQIQNSTELTEKVEEMMEEES